MSTISVNDDPTIYDKDRVLTGCRTMHRGLTRLVQAAILSAIVLAAARRLPRSTFQLTVFDRRLATASQSCWYAIEVQRTTLTHLFY